MSDLNFNLRFVIFIICLIIFIVFPVLGSTPPNRTSTDLIPLDDGSNLLTNCSKSLLSNVQSVFWDISRKLLVITRRCTDENTPSKQSFNSIHDDDAELQTIRLICVQIEIEMAILSDQMNNLIQLEPESSGSIFHEDDEIPYMTRLTSMTTQIMEAYKKAMDNCTQTLKKCNISNDQMNRILQLSNERAPIRVREMVENVFSRWENLNFKRIQILAEISLEFDIALSHVDSALSGEYEILKDSNDQSHINITRMSSSTCDEYTVSEAHITALIRLKNLKERIQNIINDLSEEEYNEHMEVTKIVFKCKKKFLMNLKYATSVMCYRKYILPYICYAAIIICCIGILTNALNILILSRKKLKYCYTYIGLGLNIFDVIFLISIIPSFITIFDIDIQHLEKIVGVKQPLSTTWQIIKYILYSVNRTAYTGSIYTTLLIIVERYFVTNWPIQAGLDLTLKKCLLTFLTVLLFSIFVNTPRWFENMKIGTNIDDCLTVEERLIDNISFQVYYLGWFWIIIMFVVPLLLVAILWLLIRKQVQRNKSGNQHQAEENNPFLTILIVSLILNCFSFFIIFIFHVILGWKSSEVDPFNNFPLIINSSIKFILYCRMRK